MSQNWRSFMDALSVIFLCLFIAVGLVQVIKPQLLWRINRPLQAPFVKDYNATVPSPAGYVMMRVVGGLVLAAGLTMLVFVLR
ncbi:DUF6199 family natural product biosynthesis protein [Streptomyces sp. NPDC029674]|uniref:DUF6199 family natural product biosynthesis protein n=1 Tax=Streptomyces sp. NPDC029674 TaxID=3365297 RepID=UPI003850ACB6